MKANLKPATGLKPSSGFTLIELVVVILLIGIISFVAAPRFFNSSVINERSAADEMLAALRFTQQMAMSRGGGIQFRTTTTSYNVELADGNPGTPLPSPDRSGNYTRSFPSGITANVVTIAFTGLGEPVPNVVTTITVGSRTITIEADTGYAHY
ncbi:MAG: type II secretion system GspH family protein [Gammaproteobacteria bacterium]|nr:type II secretion system GspH family protein [Gammaproteobacteria bacterium]